jgi:hypothetical protein
VARTGRFGRSPRSAASLTSTFVAIAREYQNQRAQNIMDAWQKGGEFEGKKATDEVVLKFWKDKAAGVSKDDPLYDTYHNAQTQLDYTIHESKMTAAYATGPKTPAEDAKMVAFYLNWAKKVPKNSEFYRALQRDAGQYMRVQRSNGEAEARRRKEEAYQKAQAATQKSKEGAGEFILDTIRRIAQSGNAKQGIAPAISAPGSGSDLTDFDPADPGVMLRLLSLITTQGTTEGSPGTQVANGEFTGSTEVIYHNDDGKAITGRDIMKQLGTLDRSFVPGVPLDVTYVTQLMDRQLQGLNERIARAKATGHMSDVVSLQKSKSYVALVNREVAAYPVQKAYQEARADYDAVVGDKSSSPNAILKAWDEYSATLTKLAQDPRIEADDATRARLVAEVNGSDGVPTLSESFTGLANGQFDASSAKDAAQNKANIEFMREQVDAVANQTAVWTFGERDSNGIFVPRAGGREIGAATPEAVQAGGLNAQVVTLPDPRGGVPLQVAVTAVPIYATAKNPLTGEPLPGTNSNPIGYAYDIPSGTGTKTQYGFNSKDGFVFSHDPLWGDSAKVTNSAKGGNHIEVDFTDEVAKSLGYGGKDPITGAYTVQPNMAQLNKDVDLPNGLSIRASGDFDEKGNPKAPTIAFSPQALAWSSGTRGALGSTDPMTDFNSLTLSTLMQDEDGRTILLNLDKNPPYRQTMQGDAYRSSGYQQDAKTGAWVPGADAKPDRLNLALNQQNIATTSKSLGEFVGAASKMFQRATTGSPAEGGVFGNPPDVMKLATDLVKNTPFEALGKMFNPGTTTIKPPSADNVNGFAINPGTAIKVPSMPQVALAPTVIKPVVGMTPSPTATTSVGQTGSTAPTPSATTSYGGGGHVSKAL